MNWLMTICAESIYIIENFLIVFGCMALLEYKGKRKILATLGQSFFIYFFQKIATDVSLKLTGGNVCSIITNILMLFCVTVVCYRGTLFRRIFAIIMYLGPALTAEAIVWPFIYQIIFKINGEMNTYQEIYAITEYRNLAIILCGQVVLILWAISLLLWKICTERYWIKEYMLFIVIPIYQLIIFMIYYNSCERIDITSVVIGWLLYMFGILIDAAILYLISGMLKKMRIEEELNALYKKRQEELAYYVQVNEYMEEVRQIRHEFANQLQVIYGLLEEKDIKKVRCMLDAMSENVESQFLKEQEESGK